MRTCEIMNAFRQALTLLPVALEKFKVTRRLTYRA
jgi:hypothetical protein